MSTTVNGPDSSTSGIGQGTEQKSHPIRASRRLRTAPAWSSGWKPTSRRAPARIPITSSTTMGGGYQAEVANGKHNLWGEELAFIEPESEHSAASTCEGFAVAGGRVTNFTSGQGLVLMKEVLFTISGKRLPIVFHIGARALTSHSLNVHAGHDDVYARRRLRLGHSLCPQRAGSRRPGADRPPRRRRHRNSVPERAGRLSHHAHHRECPAARARDDEDVRRPSRRASSAI